MSKPEQTVSDQEIKKDRPFLQGLKVGGLVIAALVAVKVGSDVLASDLLTLAAAGNDTLAAVQVANDAFREGTAAAVEAVLPPMNNPTTFDVRAVNN